jgi:two-component system, NarL family, response regulator NreC
MISVAIAEDHPEMRVALRLLIRLFSDMELVCVTSNGQEAIDCVKRLQPDVLVMDIYMPKANGFAVTKELVELAVPTRVILISLQRGWFITKQAVDVGAQGFLPKDDLVTLLRPALEAVARGETFFVE